MDPLMLGRARVRILGLHTHDKTELPTAELPWAYKVHPTTSGAISGIGHSPVGVMEGTWVLVQFIDPEKQMPFIVGTVGGIPQKKNPPLESFELLNSESNVVTSSDGTPVTTSDGTPVTTGTAPDPATQTQNSFPTRRASEFTVSESVITALKKSEAFKSCPYDDGVGVWTIGYGSTFLKDGSRVTKDTPCITQAEADELMRYKLSRDFESAVKNAVRVPITQSMYDSLVHLAYNVGGGGIRSFANESGLNAGNYEQAADFMSTFRIRPGTSVEKGLRSRRQYEKNLFLRDGVPTKDNTAVKSTPESLKKQEEQVRQANPAATQAEIDAIVYKIESIEFIDPRIGFKDPNLKYPLKTHLDEPDTNRLARHQKIRETIVYTKEVAEHKGVQLANGKGSWDQSKTPYNAKYPFNNVYQSESGHVLEFDDTAGTERVHLYHKSGTFTEIDHNGTQVNRIVGDGYQILERSGYVHIVGNLHVTVNGAHTLRVENTLDIQVNGSATINVHDNAQLNVAGNLNVSAGGNINMKAGGNFAIDASRIDLNSGNAAGLATIGSIGGTASDPAALTVNVRGEEVAGEYEFTDDNPAAQEAYKKKMIESGAATKEELEKKPEIKDQNKPADNNVQPVSTVCDIPQNQTSFTGSEKLSKYYTLADLTAGYTRKLVERNGQTPAQIFCNLKALANNVLDPLKQKYSNMQINSGFRNFTPPGGSATSQHDIGQAVDISFPGMSREALYDRVLEVQKLIPYDQIILEYASGPGWIHISFRESGNRKQQFTMNHHKRVSPDVFTIVRVY